MKELESACKTHPVSHIDMVDPQRFTLELPQCILDDPPPDYTTAWPEHLDTQASWFRHHFVGKPYTTLIRRNEANDNVMVISVVYDDDASSCTCDLYRVIIRSNDSQASSPAPNNPTPNPFMLIDASYSMLAIIL